MKQAKVYECQQHNSYCDNFDYKLKGASRKTKKTNKGNIFSVVSAGAHSIHQLLWERARGNEILSINQALRIIFVHYKQLYGIYFLPTSHNIMWY